MKKDFNRIGATLCSSMRPRSSTTSWLNKFKLLALVFMALLSVNQVWGEEEIAYTIMFNCTGTKDDGSSVTTTAGIIASGSSYMIVSDDPAPAYIYPGAYDYGIKGGKSSSGKGSITLETTNSGKVKPSKIVIRASLWASDETTKVLYASVNGGSNNTLDLDWDWINFEIEMDGQTTLNTLKLEAKNASKNRFYVQSITVYTNSISCAAPTATSNGTTTKNSQVVSWTDGSGSAWDVYCSTSNTTPTTQTTATNLSSKSYTFTGLTPATKYYWWVRANCGSSTSSWVAGTSFTTSSVTYTDYLTDCGTSYNITLVGDGTKTGGNTFSTSPAGSATGGSTVTLTANPNSCYTFTSWSVYKTGDQSTTVAVDGNSFTMPEYDVTVDATFTQKTNKISYNTDGGTHATETYGDVYVGCGNEWLAPADPVKAGYTFQGWLGAESATLYKHGQGFVPTQAQTMVAQWEAQTYTITYLNRNDAPFSGTNYDALPKTHTYGTPTTLVDAEPPTGYYFQGWYKDAGCTGTSITEIGANEITADITIYAKIIPWGCDIYSFQYGGDDVTVNNTSECFTYSGHDDIYEIANFVIPNAKNYFVGLRGYFQNSNLGNKGAKSYVVGMQYLPFEATMSNDARPKIGSNAVGAIGTLRVCDNSNWDNIYVTFRPNGYGLMYGATGTENKIAFTQTSATVWQTAPVELTADMKKTDGTFKYQVGLLKSNNDYTACGHGEAAKFGDMGSYCSGWGNNGWGNNLSTYAAGRWGYFEIWIDNVNKNWCCHFTPMYRLHYDLAGGENANIHDEFRSYAQSGTALNTTVTTEVPVRGGYTFLGWKKGETPINAGATVAINADNVVITAQWAQNYTVTYEIGGYSSSCSSETTHYCGEENITVCDNLVVPTGYTFNGWTSNITIGGKTSFKGGNKFTMPCNNVVFTADVTADEYTITYNGLEGATHSNPATYTVETTTITLQNPSARTGYNFTGWTENGTPITQIAKGTTGNKTITANWSIQNYSVTLNKNGGTINSGNVTNYTYGTGATLPTNVTKTDYKFRGWYSNEGLTEGPVTNIGTTETGNKTFWAKWEETSYSNYRTRCDNYWYVTYNANGKEIAESLPTDDNGYGDDHTADVVLSSTVLTTTGYTHIGWNTNSAATTALESPHTITGNTTFYAIWTPQVYTISYKDQGGGDYSGSNLASLPASHTYNTATNLVDGVKEGARFEGWYKDASCTDGPVTTLGATEITADITLYAKWTAVYAITYTIPTGGGTLATGAPTSAASGETVTMPGLQGTVPSPYECETLIGWTTSDAAYESKAGAMPDYFYAVGTTSPVISGATTFYAVYSRPGAGGSGTISLTNQEIIDNFKKTAQQGTGAYGTLKEYEQDGVGTWSTNGFTEAIDGIQIKGYTNPTYYYLKVPQAGGNLTKLSMTYTPNSSERTMYLNSSATTTNAYAVTIPGSSTSMTNVDISSAGISNMYILASASFRITSISLSYGAPNIISTGLNCSNTIDEFTITYNANSGQFSGATTTCTGGTFKFSELQENKYTICSDATCAGMTLVGWNSQANGQGGLNYTPGQEISSVSQDVFTLYAQFAYNVTVKDNDATTNVHPIERGGTIDLDGGKYVCESAKYDFIGWTTDNPETWKQTITSPYIFSSKEVTTYRPTAAGTQVTAVYGMSTSVGSQAFYISYNDGSTVHYLKFNGESKNQTTTEAEATAMYRENINSAENKYHLYYMNSGVKTYFYYNNSDLAVSTSNPGQSYGWVITTNGAGVSTFQSIIKSTAYLSYSSNFTTHTEGYKRPLTITTGAKEYKYYDVTTCTEEITITFDAGGGTMDPVTTQIVGHEGTTITVPECSYPGWTWIGWVNTRAAAQSDIKIADEQIYTNEDSHEYEIGSQDETLYAYYTKTPVPPTFDGEISDVWKIYVTTVDGGGNDVYHYESGSKDITNPSAHGEYTTTTRCIDGTNWAFTNVGTNQFTIQNPAGLYLSGASAGDDNDIFFSADPSVWTMTDKGNGFYKFVNQNTPNRYLAFRVGNGAPTFINTSTANETNPSSYSYIKVGGCTVPVYTTSPGGEFKLNMLGNVRVTSTNNKTVRSVDALSISADNLTPNTAITLTDNLGVLTFCDATGAALSLTTDGTGKLANTAVYVKYTPTAYNTTDMPTITATCGEQHQDFAGLVKGRSLPEKFIIAQKVGDDWYALPNNMSNTQTNPAAVKISAVNEATGTATIYSDVTDHLAYQLLSKGTGTGVAFSSPVMSGNIIKAHNVAESNTIGLYAPGGWKSTDVQFYEFTPVTSDLADYTLQNVFQTNYLGITEGNWGIGASNNVRFLAIDQQPAATITWQNEMLGTQHAQNAAEDGVITLPTIADPIACERAIETGWVFFGWGDQIATKRTAEPAILVGGEAATADKTYYAIFRRGTEDVWRTSCPTVNTITYKANGGEGDDHVEYTELTTATAITVGTAGFTKEGSQFIGWTVEGSEDALIQPGGTISGINSDIIVNAQWMGELVISGEVKLTSADGQKVATAATGITFSSTDMSYATELRITYRDETNSIDYPRSGTPSYTSSEFRLCYGSYNVADGGNISLADVTGAYEQTYSISYTPNGGVNTLDHYTMKVEVLRSATVIATVTKDLYGRTLPEKFAIVAHVGDMWYALPNNMTSSSTYAPVAVSVDNSDASILNWTATGAKTAGYSMKDMTADYNKLRFASKFDANEYCLWASTSGNTDIRNWSATSTDAAYQWTVTPDANFQAYTLLNENNGRTLRLNGSLLWGMYASGGTNVVYFIPLTDMEVADFQVIEWFANKVLIETNNQAINTSAAKTSVGSGEYTDAIVDGTTYGTNQYTLTTGDLTTSAGKSLNIQYQTTAGDAWYMNSVKVPIIVSRGKKATSTDLLGGLDNQSKYKDNDLVVRDGATLTVDASTGTWNTFKNVTIYPTSKVVVPAKSSDDTKDVTMTTTTMTLFGGIDEIYDGSAYTLTKYIVPQLVLNGTLVHSATTSGLVYDVRVDKAQYYNFALPYTSKYELVTDNKGGYDYKYWVKVYNGQTRVETGNGWVYYDWDADPWALNIGTGYMLEAQSTIGQNYVILRHPLGYSNTGSKYAQNTGGHQSGTAEETKAAVNVTAPGMVDGEIMSGKTANNVGWNFIANPFMANFQLDQDGETATIQVGHLEEHIEGDKWNGKYDWNKEEGKNVRYVTLYNNGTDTYTQLPMSEAVLAPFTGFFVQIAKEGTIVFDINGRADKAPARMLNDDELPSEMEVKLKVNGQNESDETVMLLTKDLHRDNAREFPNEMTKQENAGTLNFYTYGGETKMYANGMSYTDGQTWSNAGLMVAKEGSYTFSVTGADNEHVSHVILRDKYSNTEYDLKHTDAEIYLEAGEVNDRFDVKLVLDEHGVTTEWDNVRDNNNPEKFIYNDKMFIRVNGRIYDATGKRVNK